MLLPKLTGVGPRLAPAPARSKLPSAISNQHSAGCGLLESIPARIARSRHTLNAKRELARVARVEQRAVVRDDDLCIPRHQRLVEALHAILDGAFADEIRNVQRLVQVADLFTNGRGVDEDLAGRDAAGAVDPRNEAHGNDGSQDRKSAV